MMAIKLTHSKGMAMPNGAASGNPSPTMGRAISKGTATGNLLICDKPISFYGGVDPNTGVVVEKGHPLEGKSIAGAVLAFPHGKGSTVGSYILYRLKKNGHAPVAILNQSAEAIVAVGAIISDIPMADQVDFKKLENIGNKVKVEISQDGTVSITSA